MTGKIMEKQFTGYLPEITGYLALETVKNGLPSFAFKTVDRFFIYAYAYRDVDSDKLCKSGETFMRVGSGNVSIQLRRDNIHHELLKCIGNTKSTNEND